MSNARELRDLFLSEAPAVMEKMILHSKSNANPNLSGIQSEMWDLIKDTIKKVEDREKIEVESAADVIGLLKKGDLSASEATELLNVLKAQQDLEELPKLVEALQDLKK